jgi:hypothetical protein
MVVLDPWVSREDLYRVTKSIESTANGEVESEHGNDIRAFADIRNPRRILLVFED